jgi:sugar phosphate isomerase/epimerase
MDYGFVTDELSDEPREAIEAALEWGVRRFEIRSVWGERFPRCSLPRLDELASLQDEYGVAFTAVSPGFFKCPTDSEPEIAYALGDGLNRSMDFMESQGIRLLVCFGFTQKGSRREHAIEHLRTLAEACEARGVKAAVENEAHHLFDAPGNMAAMVEEIARDGLGLNWDPGNLKQHAAGAFPEGYERVKPYILNVHAKDVARDENGEWRWRLLGEGVYDWPGQMAALDRDGIVEHVAIENHVHPRMEAGRRNLAYLREL